MDRKKRGKPHGVQVAEHLIAEIPQTENMDYFTQFDPDGSYTGASVGEDTRPVQDADDL
ncbi:MAG: hypothetical protein RRY38_02670 [Oscillospiraceae bacterium]